MTERYQPADRARILTPEMEELGSGVSARDVDRMFKVELARRLADAFPHAELRERDDVKTFVPYDRPDVVAEACSNWRGAPSPDGLCSRLRPR
jgi:hypothetical protein